MKTKFIACLIAGICCAGVSFAQFVHGTSSTYIAPKDELVREKLDHWQDQKFGMIVHWGLYSIPGIVESWSICSEDESWIPRDSTMAYDDYKKWYFNLAKEFNPVKFDPLQWAKAGKAAGMNYIVFTTKHHDGYCLFDSKETDFKVTNGLFAGNPKANIAKHVFEAFRQEGYMIGAYFSKPDWHSQDYWWDRYATPNRNVNYRISQHQWKWNRFKEYTFNQISELMHNYGSIDILWLDGGWVRPLTEEEQRIGNRSSQDIDMPRIAAMARKAHPGLLMVDRTVHGEYENYQTPEQNIPPVQLPYPWETCMTLGADWGYVPNQSYKPSRKVIHSLIEIVAKGGSLLLGVGPLPEGLLPDIVVERLREIGAWTSQNGNAIYATRSTSHYNDGNVWFTQSKDGKTLYAMACLQEGESIPTKVEWGSNIPAKGAKMILLHTGKAVKWKMEGDKVVVTLPKDLPKELPALAFKFKK
ncbi:MAG: alpha-L-fucosidase [Cytophagaceae bacterium]|jgi:alpha-L-fucosidase|nr:alpha-L-fucosidase [Cytophagaceae bacterium]